MAEEVLRASTDQLYSAIEVRVHTFTVFFFHSLTSDVPYVTCAVNTKPPAPPAF